MSKITLLVGPPGSGKSTYAQNWLDGDSDCEMKKIRISQDDQGKDHLKYFNNALASAQYNILVDRMNFNKVQRERYLKPARDAGYTTEIVVLHVPKKVCLERMKSREGHPTIKNLKDANNALNTFFGKYERVSDDEANKIIRLGWEGEKEAALVIDADGTLCDIRHRLHYVSDKPVDSEDTQRKDWPKFFSELKNDKVNVWCKEIIERFSKDHKIVICSGRPDNYKLETKQWLGDNNIQFDCLLMRQRNDFRPDHEIKQIILDFELKPKYNILFCVDDRKVVTEMWRRNNLICLQCDFGDF